MVEMWFTGKELVDLAFSCLGTLKKKKKKRTETQTLHSSRKLKPEID